MRIFQLRETISGIFGCYELHGAILLESRQFPMARKISLFVPCFVDQLQQEVAVDTVKVLRRIGCEVDFPTDQTC